MSNAWCIQATLISMEDSEGLADAVTDNGLTPSPIYMKPFMDELPEIEIPASDRPIFYGSTKLIELAENSEYSQSVYYEDAKFKYSYHVELNGENMLNHDCEIHKLGTVLYRDEPFFVRPLGDLKQFSGMLVSDPDYYGWQKELIGAGMDDYLDIDVMVATPKTIDTEHRVFYVDGEMLDVTRYIAAGQRKDAEASDTDKREIRAFLNDIAMPMPAVVCDVARTPDGWKVIEFNCINGSGFYGHDFDRIVKGLSEYHWASGESE